MLFAVAVAAAVTMLARARPHGRGDRKDLPALHLLGKGDGSVRHALLVFTLIDFQTVCFLLKRLPKPNNVAMARQHKHAAYEREYGIVSAQELIF